MDPSTCARLLLALVATAQEPEPSAPAPLEWAQWRGPLATGVAPDANPPVRWSEDENVRWRTDLPGKGHSSPVVAGGRVFLTTAVPWGEEREPILDDAPGAHDALPVTRAHRFVVLALDLEDGGIEWQTVVREELPNAGGHVTGSYASASPATDGEVVVASFGSHGLYVLDVEGTLLWKRELGAMNTKHDHGEGSTPLLAGDSVVVVHDHEDQSFVAAFDRLTGDERWRRARDEPTSWASPIAVQHDGRTQVIVSGTERLRAYDLADGEVLWECGGLSHNVVATPVAADGIVVAGSSYEHQAMVAVDLARARGDVSSGDAVLWFRRRATPYVPSPLLYRDRVWFLHHYQGFLARVDARTGDEPHRPLRLEGVDDVYASPVAAADRVYVTDRSGLTVVLSAEDEPRVLARNELDDSFSASAALVGDALLLRGERRLYCLGE